MIYVTSDLHGYPLEEFQKLLSQAGFCDDDFLFVLGDVIDRGEEGVRLLRWMAEQPNVQLILGNHEAMLLRCAFLFREITEENAEALTAQDMEHLALWRSNGADPTLAAFKDLLRTKPDVMEGILDYLNEAPLYDYVVVDGRPFILVHAGLGNFSPDKPFHRYEAEDLLWVRPGLETRYFDEATVIFGHTPTYHYGESYRGKAIKTDTRICIDTGAAAGGHPMLLRLDDMQEFYGPCPLTMRA